MSGNLAASISWSSMFDEAPTVSGPTASERTKRVAPWLMVMALLCALPAAAQTVEIVTPRHLSTALGPTTVEVQVVASAVERLEILVDGVAVATLTSPPWTAEWDAGDGARGHRVEAVLFLTDGSAVRSAVRTSPLRINASLEVNLVNLYPLILDGSGAYVGGLTREDFRVYENNE